MSCTHFYFKNVSKIESYQVTLSNLNNQHIVNKLMIFNFFIKTNKKQIKT